MMSRADFTLRRQRVMDAIGPNAAMIVAAAPELRVGADTELRYVVDPDLFYLTGYTEPEAIAVLRPAAPEKFTMFVRPRDRARETWTGVRGGVEAAVEVFGADQACPIGELRDRLPKLLADLDAVHVGYPSQRPEVDELIAALLVAGRRSRPRTGRGPGMIIDPILVLSRMRQIKDDIEIAAMRSAADLTVDAFGDAARTIRPGAGEWQVEAAIDAAFRGRGATGPSFPTIAASASNATVLHHVSNDRVMAAGDLLLLDAGARLNMYCADITRTFPVGGRFEGRTRDVYDIVLAAHDAAIDATAPGATIPDVHLAALRILVRGMVDLGLLNGDVATLIAEETQLAAYYPHRTSHWLGLDVHDVGDYVAGGAPIPLEPGMVFTIEPGLYIPSDAEAPGELRGIGVRIEDDVLVTAAGHDVLTGALPVLPDEVAAMVG
jgi:Xaa-Pro aminopeptidase